METGKTIAMNLRALRTERNLTLGQLSQLSGTSKAMLGEIEKGGSNPTINTLLKIANGLNVPYTRLLETVETEAAVVRREEAEMQSEAAEHYRIHCYFKTSPTRNFEVFYAELDGGRSSTSIGHPPRAQEYLYVISGQLCLYLDRGDFVLNAGDAVMFDSSVRHTYENAREETVRFTIINYYPA